MVISGHANNQYSVYITTVSWVTCLLPYWKTLHCTLLQLLSLWHCLILLLLANIVPIRKNKNSQGLANAWSSPLTKLWNCMFSVVVGLAQVTKGDYTNVVTSCCCLCTCSSWGYTPTPNFVKMLLFIAIQIPLECTNVIHCWWWYCYQNINKEMMNKLPQTKISRKLVIRAKDQLFQYSIQLWCIWTIYMVTKHN